MSIQEALYHPLLYSLVAILIVFVALVSGAFARISYKEALRLGFSKDALVRMIRSTVISSIVPSLAVMLGLFALAVFLGNAWPWLRLSVIGSVTYELLASDIALTALGGSFEVAGLAGLINVMLVMSLGISAGLILLLLFGQKIQQRVQKIVEQPLGFGSVALESFMIALAVTFLPAFWTLSWVHFLSFLSSLTITLALGLLMQKLHWTWLKDFILAFALLGGMGASLLFHAWLGGL